jgi:inhibitor of KinA
MSYQLKIILMGAKCLLINWPNKINQDINLDSVSFNNQILKTFNSLIVETVCAYCSVTLYLKDTVDTANLIDELELLYASNTSIDPSISTIWNIPVCYDLSFGLDLQQLADSKSMTIEEVIKLHTQPLYHVYFLGFLPGFPYLGGLDPQLKMPRLASPRIKIAKGSVAIGDQQTGIYPSMSPGGWNIIGRTPIDLFDVNRQPPTFIKAGDKVKFKSISLEEYQYMFDQVKHDNFHYEDLKSD